MKNDSLAGQIKERIFRLNQKEIFSVTNFSDLGRDDIVTKTLYRMEKSGDIIRIARGLYMKPVQTQFGLLKSTVDDLAYAIADKNHETIIPTGNMALNILGFSTQVPMNAVYLTNASARTLNMEKRKIVFKKGNPKYFLYKSGFLRLIVLAYKELGKNGISDEIIEKTSELIQNNNEDNDILLADANLAPVWIKNILIPIIRTKQSDI